MQWFAQAPSNIALIKYMGKAQTDLNLPANPSLSYTLNKLVSNVSLESVPGKSDRWEPLETPGVAHFSLSEKAISRYLAHLNFLKKQFLYRGAFIVRSNNNFPTGNGLASSASSFAALTRAACRALSELTQKPLPNDESLANLSRQGSGSSCRSFFSPWCIWDGDSVKQVDIPYDNLLHRVIIISHDEKQIPSSLAHELVTSSPLYRQRPKRAAQNLKLLMNAFTNKDWKTAYDICWKDFQDMHQLFSTCSKPFMYMHDESRNVLRILQRQWELDGDGPIVTMDAGPNIHLLYREDQRSLAEKFKHEHLVGSYDFI